MTWSGIEAYAPGVLVNTLLTKLVQIWIKGLKQEVYRETKFIQPAC